MNFLRLFHRYVVRDVLHNPVRSLFTLTGVALGIAVVAGVYLANDRAIGSFEESLRALAGQADLQVTSNGLQLNETLISELSWVWDIGTMTSIVEGQALVDPSRKGTEVESLQIFGIDLLSDHSFRNYTLSEGKDLALNITNEQFINLLVDPRLIVIPSLLAQELRLQKDETLRLLVANRWQDFRVAAILGSEGVAAASGGRILFMDIAGAQTALRKEGWIDRIEVVVNDPGLLDAVEARIRAQLPESVIVERPENKISNNEKMFLAFRYNLTALSYIALIVGMILIYNTLNIAVVRRRVEIGTLRALGTSSRTIGWLFLLEAISFGVIGAAIGLWGGQLLASTAGMLVSQTISTLYTGTTVIPEISGFDTVFSVQMLLLGGSVSAMAGAGPALRATKISPIEILRENVMGPFRPLHSTSQAVAGLSGLLIGTSLAFGPPLEGFPFLGYASGLVFIVSFGLLSPWLARILLSLLRKPLSRALPVEGTLAIRTVDGSLRRIVVAVMSLALAVAMLISVAIMIASFRETVIVWIDQTIKGDLYLGPATRGNQSSQSTIEEEVLHPLQNIPAIEAIDRFRSIKIKYAGFPAFLAAGEFATLASHGQLLFMDGRTTLEVSQRLIGAERIIVSEPFAVRHGVSVGDEIMLPTPKGIEPFAVEAIFYDYSSEGGLVVMDRGTYLKNFNDTRISNVALYLSDDADPIATRATIAALPSETQLRITTNEELRTQVLRVFDQTFEITYALEFIAIAVAVLGIANTLVLFIIERRPEIAMLKFIGAAQRQIKRVVIIESFLIGVLGSAIGLMLGLVLSLILVYVINFQSFGWTIQLAMPWRFLLHSIIAVLVATVIAGLYPAAVALKMDPIKGIRTE